MTDEARAVKNVLAPLRDPLLQVDPVAVETRRQRIVPGLLAQVAVVRAARARRRRRWGAVSIGFVAASAYFAVIGLARYREQGVLADRAGGLEVVSRTGLPTLTVGSESRQVLAGVRALVGVLDSGPGGSALLRRPDGLELAVAENTRIRVDELGERNQIMLESGSASFRVPRQAPGRRFAVVTPFGRVVVKGTRFVVDLSAGLTCVRVEEGVVQVEHGATSTTLHPNETWGCERAPAEAQVALPAPQPARSEPRKVEPAMRGTLRDETSLLEAALLAERRGDLATARAKLEELARRYPKSPLLPEAHATLSRLRGR